MSHSLRCHLVRMFALLVCAASITAAYAQSFADDFEAPSIDPFWMITANSGSVALTSVQAHSGQQAVRFDSTNTGIQKTLRLHHDFPEPVYGRVSVWVYDTGADTGSSNYLYISVSNSETGGSTSIGTRDYDLGPGNEGSSYYYYPGTGPTDISTGIDRTQGWHRWTIDSQLAYLRIEVDGITVYDGQGGSPFDTVAFGMFGPEWRPAWTSFFDDFCFEQTPSYAVCPLYDPTKAVKSGATIPIKIQVCDADGANLSAPTLAVHATGVTQVSDAAPGTLQDAGNANPDFDFRYDATLGGTGGYIFNLKTTGLSTGTYRLDFVIGGGTTTYSVEFRVR